MSRETIISTNENYNVVILYDKFSENIIFERNIEGDSWTGTGVNMEGVTGDMLRELADWLDKNKLA